MALPALKYALRDRDVIVWQVDFWTRTIVDRADELAEKVGLEDDEAAVVAAAAYRSSAPAWFNDVIRRPGRARSPFVSAPGNGMIHRLEQGGTQRA